MSVSTATSTAGVALAALCLGAVGCLPYTRATAGDGEVFDLLYRRDLSGFEQRIAVENHVGAADEWTRVGEAWLDLANCRPVDRDPFAEGADPSADAQFVYATLVLEDTRRRLRAARSMSGARRGTSTLLVDRMRRGDFFERAPDETPSDVIRWPGEDEQWADEKPAPIRVGHQCDRLPRQLRQPHGGLPGRGETESDAKQNGAQKQASDDGTSGRTRRWTLHDWRAELLGGLERVIRTYEPLSETDRDGRVAELYWRTRLYGAATAARFARGYRGDWERPDGLPDGRAKRLATDSLEGRAAEWLGPMLEADPPAAEFLADASMARARLLGATIAARAGQRETARSRLAQALSTGLSGTNRWGARYLLLRILTRAGRWKAAAALADELPPPTSAYFSPYVYRVGLALRRIDRDDRFLSIAKSVFGEFSPDSNPFLRGLYGEMLRLMVQYSFEDRVVELLEEYGPRSGVYDRVAEFARICLARGRPDNAEAAARWLMENHDDARYEPRYRGLLALVAFQRDDPQAFRRQIREITERPKSLLEAIPAGRRAEFFAPADSALARVLRQMLPMMAEWGETAPAEKRRRKWLEIIVEQTQTFLRQTDESIARSTLEEMYQMASALLEDHPRGYAERVGDEPPAPLVLGTVRVGAGKLERFEPSIRVRCPEPYSLTLIPRDDRPPSEWTFRWPDSRADQNDGGSDA